MKAPQRCRESYLIYQHSRSLVEHYRIVRVSFAHGYTQNFQDPHKQRVYVLTLALEC